MKYVTILALVLIALTGVYTGYSKVQSNKNLALTIASGEPQFDKDGRYIDQSYNEIIGTKKDWNQYGTSNCEQLRKVAEKQESKYAAELQTLQSFILKKSKESVIAKQKKSVEIAKTSFVEAKSKYEQNCGLYKYRTKIPKIEGVIKESPIKK